MRWYVRVAYELCVFAIVCVFAYELMVVKRTLMIWFEAATTRRFHRADHRSPKRLVWNVGPSPRATK